MTAFAVHCNESWIEELGIFKIVYVVSVGEVCEVHFNDLVGLV